MDEGKWPFLAILRPQNRKMAKYGHFPSSTRAPPTIFEIFGQFPIRNTHNIIMPKKARRFYISDLTTTTGSARIITRMLISMPSHTIRKSIRSALIAICNVVIFKNVVLRVSRLVYWLKPVSLMSAIRVRTPRGASEGSMYILISFYVNRNWNKFAMAQWAKRAAGMQQEQQRAARCVGNLYIWGYEGLVSTEELLIDNWSVLSPSPKLGL